MKAQGSWIRYLTSSSVLSFLDKVHSDFVIVYLFDQGSPLGSYWSFTEGLQRPPAEEAASTTPRKLDKYVSEGCDSKEPVLILILKSHSTSEETEGRQVH